MADTFNNDLRVREQEAGSNSGTWGTLLNATISNLASAFGQGSEAIPDAATHTITLADGAADEARSMYLKCTGGGQACTVTLAPNTISKVWIISNETSDTLTFSQGSGANVAVSAGGVKMIVTDGAGSGAAITDALSGLELSAGTVTTSAIADDAVTAAQIADNAVDIARLNVSDGSAGQSLTTNGSGTLSFATIGGAFNDFAIKTANYTAVSKDQLIVNSSSAVTITLPASPSAGNVVFIKNAGSAAVTVARNGSNINSTADDGELAADAGASLVYVDATIGWEEL
jgi:hypothetical protein